MEHRLTNQSPRRSAVRVPSGAVSSTPTDHQTCSLRCPANGAALPTFAPQPPRLTTESAAARPVEASRSCDCGQFAAISTRSRRMSRVMLDGPGPNASVGKQTVRQAGRYAGSRYPNRRREATDSSDGGGGTDSKNEAMARAAQRGTRATARSGPPEPPSIFIGRAMTTAPRAGSRSRFVRFSNPGTFLAAAIRCTWKSVERP
jgi:hypothetical protein